MKANILVYDVGSTYTKGAAFCLADGKLTFLARGQHPTTLENIGDGARGAEAEIRAKGVEFAPDMIRFSSCSAAGGLRMVAMGFMPRVTAKAAKEVAMTAGARVMEVVSADEPPEFREEVLREIKPDIILLSGGTDGGDMANVLENADIICKVHGEGTVILGCNKFAQREAAEKFRAAGIECIRVPNILPTIHELNVKPARIAIHEQFINQITHAKGLKEFRDTLADQTVIPTPGAVLLASELLAKGSYEKEGVGGVILVDIGGATTDIHSALPELIDMNIEERGLVVSNEKQFSYRTVEGNLGLRVSATGIPEAVGDKAILRAMDHDYGLTPEDVESYVSEHNVRFSLAFGPIIIQDGKECTPRGYIIGEINKNLTRAALCQLGVLHYVVVTVNMEPYAVCMPTLKQFATRLWEMGIPTAYSLDGGQTATIVMEGTLINSVDYGDQRDISDIIYFATALPEVE